MSAMRSTHTTYEAGFSERRQELLEVGFGNELSRGDISALNGSLTEVSRQIDHGS